MNDYWIYGVGFCAQLLFAARLLIQWIKSEKAGRILSPTLFWQLSLLASILMVVYGILRADFVVILGQVFSYFVYIRNLQYKNAWKLIPHHFKILVVIFPIAAISYLWFSHSSNLLQILHNPEISTLLLVWGSLGQFIFTFRFVYQWYVSEGIKKSILPLEFWLISITGSLIIVSYAIFRVDPVLFLGQIFGIFIYARNILIFYKGKPVSASKVNG